VVALLSLLLLASCGTSESQGAVHPASLQRASGLPVTPVGHSGRWLTDAEGRVLLVHGVNMVSKQTPYYPAAFGFSSADATWLAANGFRVVRLGVLATGLMPSPGTVDQAYINHLATTVTMLASHGILTLLDFHQDGWGPSVGSDGFPAWMTLTGSAVNNHASFPLYYVQNPAIQQAFQSFWDNADGPNGVGLQTDYIRMFAALARTFADNPNVLGYDLFNEPWPGTAWKPCLAASGCPSLDASELAPIYAKAVAAIRSAGDHHLVFGEPFVLFDFGRSQTTIPLPGNDPQSSLSIFSYTVSPALEPRLLSQCRRLVPPDRWSAPRHRVGGNQRAHGDPSPDGRVERCAHPVDLLVLPWRGGASPRSAPEWLEPGAVDRLRAGAALPAGAGRRERGVRSLRTRAAAPEPTTSGARQRHRLTRHLSLTSPARPPGGAAVHHRLI